MVLFWGILLLCIVVLGAAVNNPPTAVDEALAATAAEDAAAEDAAAEDAAAEEAAAEEAAAAAEEAAAAAEEAAAAAEEAAAAAEEAAALLGPFARAGAKDPDGVYWFMLRPAAEYIPITYLRFNAEHYSDPSEQLMDEHGMPLPRTAYGTFGYAPVTTMTDDYNADIVGFARDAETNEVYMVNPRGYVLCAEFLYRTGTGLQPINNRTPTWLLLDDLETYDGIYVPINPVVSPDMTMTIVNGYATLVPGEAVRGDRHDRNHRETHGEEAFAKYGPQPKSTYAAYMDRYDLQTPLEPPGAEKWRLVPVDPPPNTRQDVRESVFDPFG